MKEKVYQHQITGNIIKSMINLKGWLKDYHYYIEIFPEEKQETPIINSNFKIKTSNPFKHLNK